MKRVHLNSGGTIEIKFDGDFMQLSLADREFLMGIRLLIDEYFEDGFLTSMRERYVSVLLKLVQEWPAANDDLLDRIERALQIQPATVEYEATTFAVVDDPDELSAIVTADSPRPVNEKPMVRRGPRPHKFDYAEIARVYVDAVSEGRKVIDALAEHFNVKRSTAKNWPQVCRNLNLLPPRDQPVIEAVAPMQFVRHA